MRFGPSRFRGSGKPQPVPLTTLVSRVDGRFTAIARIWPAGQASACRLCRVGTCCAVRDACMIVVHRPVPDDAAPQFSTVDLTRDGPGHPGLGIFADD